MAACMEMPAGRRQHYDSMGRKRRDEAVVEIVELHELVCEAMPRPHVDALGRDDDSKEGVTIWFPLDPVNVKNGCLHYLRGSHRKRYLRVIPIPNIDQE